VTDSIHENVRSLLFQGKLVVSSGFPDSSEPRSKHPVDARIAECGERVVARAAFADGTAHGSDAKAFNATFAYRSGNRTSRIVSVKVATC